MRLKKMHQAFLLSVMGITVSGCMNDDGDDLDQFIRDAGKNMQVKIKPLPEMKSYLSFEFNADGALSDPFKLRKNFKSSGILAPDLDRPKEPMESFPVESIKYVGMIQRSNLSYALMQTPDNTLQKVQVGNYIGQDFGVVTEIKENEVVLKEVIQDEASGDWINQLTMIALHE